MFCPESSLIFLEVDVGAGEKKLSAYFLEKNSKSLLCSLYLKWIKNGIYCNAVNISP